MRHVVVTVVVLVVALAAAAGTYVWMQRDPEPPAAGVPLGLAQDRAARISNLRYDAKFQVPARREEPVRGSVTARFALADTNRPVAFDFAQPAEQVGAVRANERTVQPIVANGHIVIPTRALVAGENAIELEFVAGDAALNRNDEFLYSLFVPARASLAMPCFDQPDLKARWTISLTVPAGWTAVSNGREVSRTPAADPASQEITFAETQPLSTYLVAFAAGKFSVETAVRGAREFRMFHRETDPAKVARNRKPSSICTRAPWPGSRITPASRIPGASSTSWSSRRSSSAAWSTPARSSTTRAACCSTKPPPRISSSAAPP